MQTQDAKGRVIQDPRARIIKSGGSGGGGGAVSSVNGKTGAVVLDYDDVGAAEETHTHTKSEVTDFPTAVSAFTNDAGYLTSHQSLSAYRTSAAQDVIDAGKVDEPASEGTSGQVLTTDGAGGRTWTTVGGGGGITLTLLWENSSPTSSWSSGTISCAACANYNAFVFVFRIDTSVTHKANFFIFQKSTNMAINMARPTSSSAKWFGFRYVSFTDSGVSVSGGYKCVGSTQSTDNSIIIPLQLYGVSGVTIS